ncbi:matrixin family metalloprotease [Actinoplanes sp. NPDC048796]|uniref:matrixin family metalloprotease n=1 Tax=Actinoplanes sp. NPDC048796 TaxID=3155640 RepID=UPI0033E7F515
MPRWSRAVFAVVAALPLIVMQPGVAQAAGNAKAYKLLSQTDGKGPVARWNPCAGPIDYRVNLTRAPQNSLPEVKTAFANVAKATGLTFRYAGTTAAIPAATKGYSGVYPAGTEIVIAWVTPGVHSSMLGKTTSTAGMGGYMARGAFTASGAQAWAVTEGRVVLNADLTKKMARGFAAGQGGTTGQLLMHEIGHAVGLDHPKIADRYEIMYPMLTTKKAAWGAGDLVGLRLVGKTAGCLSTVNPKA